MATEPTIKPGDVVVLKSGGPPMTVMSLSMPTQLPPTVQPASQTGVTCVFFDADGRRVTENLYLHLIRQHEVNDPRWEAFAARKCPS